MKVDYDTLDFMAAVRAFCLRHGVKLRLSRGRFVTTDTGCRCNGFFDEDTLTVAAGQPRDSWLKILVHEYGHATQWADNTRIWRACKVGSDAEEITELWYAGKLELTQKQRAYWIAKARDVELECEKRTVRLIDKFRLPIDKTDYIKRANAYLFFWTYTAESRAWYGIGKEPYNIPEIVSAMPTHFRKNYGRLPDKYRALYKRYC